MENQALTQTIQRNDSISRFNWSSTSTQAPISVATGAAIIAQFQIPKYVLYGVILTLSIVGNVAVVHIIQTRRSIRKTSYVLLVLNLAICDAITPTISIPIDWVFEEYDNRWNLGAVLCKLLWPLQTLFSTSSALTLTMICYDRFRAVVHPFKARLVTKTHIKLCIFAIHLTSCVFTIPYAVVLRLQGDDCHEQWPSPISTYRKAYTLILFLVQYGIPLILMVSLHSLALMTLRGQSNDTELLREGSTRSRSRSTLSNASQTSLQFKIAARKKEQNVRVAKIFVMVVMVFTLSMFPNQVLWLWVDFGNGAENEYFAIISAVCRLFTYSNSILNPIIYGFYSREFRPVKTKLRSNTGLTDSKLGTRTGFNLTANRAVNGMEIASRNKGFKYAEAPCQSLNLLNHSLPDRSNDRTIHLKENYDTVGKQNRLPSFFVSAIKNDSVALNEHHGQQNAANQDDIKPSENRAARNDVLSRPSQLHPRQDELEEKDHTVFTIPEYALRHFDDIRESKC